MRFGAIMASAPAIDSSFNSIDDRPVVRRKSFYSSFNEDTKSKTSEDYHGKSAIRVKKRNYVNLSSNDNINKYRDLKPSNFSEYARIISLVLINNYFFNHFDKYITTNTTSENKFFGVGQT